MVYLMTFVIIVILAFATCAGCSISRKPAKQQQNITSNPPPVPQVQQNIPVASVDLDQDGTISETERRSLMGDQPDVLLTFGTIVGLVLAVSVITAWASARWGHDQRSAADDTSAGAASEEPAAPEQRDYRGERDNFL